jgi:type I restriction enzyme S subunit
VAQFLRGINFKPDDIVPVGTEGTVVCLRTKNIQKSLDCDDIWAVSEDFVRRPEQILKEGDLLVSSANSWNLVGKCCWIPNLSWRTTFGGFVSVLRANPTQIEPRFLYWWFSADRTQALLRSFGQQTTNISNLNIERCLNLDIPLFPRAEQSRIAAILDVADALRAKHREALAQLDRLTQAIFIEMFGELMGQNHRWQSKPVSHFVAGFESGKSVAADDKDDVTSSFRVLKVSAVTSLEYKPHESKAAPANYVPAKSYFVRDGDLLFSRANTTDLIGATAYVKHTPPNMLLSDKLWRFVWHEIPRAEPLFVAQLFRQRKFRAEIARRASGTSGSMKNISQDKVLSINVGLPSLDLQQTFANRLRCIEQIKAAYKKSLSQHDTLFVVLQQRAFSGKL